MLWFTTGWVLAFRLTRSARLAPAAWQLEVNALCARMKIHREVRVGIIEGHGSPVATGLFRATILLPRSALSWSDDRRHAVLLHEIAHIKRRDCPVQLVAQIACAMYWFNPLVWLAAYELRRERERACDDTVLQHGALASSYAMHLLDIARELQPTRRPSAALAMARPSELEGRLLAVLAPQRARVPARTTRWAVVAAISSAAIGAHAATTVERRTHTPAPAPARYVVSTDVFNSSQPPAPPLTEARETLQSSPNAEERERATLALAFSSGRDVIPALIDALRDPEPQVREKAAVGLALRRDPRPVTALIDAMSDPDSQVREKVAIALGTSGDPRAQAALTRALDDRDAQVRKKAAAALVLLGLTRD